MEAVARSGPGLSVEPSRVRREQAPPSPTAVNPGQAAELARRVIFEEAPSADIENAFLILRPRVTAGADGAPHIMPERLATQPVGFTGFES